MHDLEHRQRVVRDRDRTGNCKCEKHDAKDHGKGGEGSTVIQSKSSDFPASPRMKTYAKITATSLLSVITTQERAYQTHRAPRQMKDTGGEVPERKKR